MSALLNSQQITVSIGGKTICENLSLTIKAGEIWGLLGANGSGKTTILNTFAHLHPQYSGNIYLQGIPLTQIAPLALAQRIGLLFQTLTNNFPQTVWEYCLGARYPHLGYFKRERSEDKAIAASALRCMALENHLLKNIQHLSGGEKRRLQIAALLTQRPKLYLLDEPTNHLDLHHQIKALNTFAACVKQPETAVLMTLHDINLAQRYCTHLLLLLPDGTHLQGPVTEMLRPDVLSAVYQCHIKGYVHSDGVFWGV